MQTKDKWQETGEILAEFFLLIWEDMKKHGQPVQNNKELWQAVNAFTGERGKDIWKTICKLASQAPRYDIATKMHNQTLLEQDTFRVRETHEQNKSCENNTKAWKTIMCANDVIQASKKQNNFFGLFD